MFAAGRCAAPRTRAQQGHDRIATVTDSSERPERGEDAAAGRRLDQGILEAVPVQARTLTSSSTVTPADAIAEFLETGQDDPMHLAWRGANLLERARRGDDELTGALITEVRSRAAGRRWGDRVKLPSDMAAYTCAWVHPMVRGLFAKAEHEPILGLLERSVVLVTDDTVEGVIRDLDWLPTAWNIANLYLASIGADVLGDADDIHVGLSENLRCYVTPKYFERCGPFVDYVVHECAHVLHDAKLKTIGLRMTRSRERLVEVELRERETFAYSCEAFATIATERSPSKRAGLVERFRERRPFPPSAVDVEKVEAIVEGAAARRNGWKHVLERCAPDTPPRYRIDRPTHRGEPGRPEVATRPSPERGDDPIIELASTARRGLDRSPG